MSIFWANPLVGGLVTLALVMLFWPLISTFLESRKTNLGTHGTIPAK
jgi:putative tricarboxylic transport membrane protein